MKIYNAKPPVWNEILENFDVADKKIVITYGDIIYLPNGGDVSDNLLVHEKTHSKQQGNNPEEWWRKYFLDKDFRLEQEIEAYRNQYQFVKNQTKDRNYLYKFLYFISSDLASSIYGNIISLKDAMEKIK